MVLRHLNAMGIETWMVTGDNRTTANSVAQKLGLAEDFVMAEVLPGNKARQASIFCPRRMAWACLAAC